MEWVTEWAGQLADVADSVTKQIPEKDEWDILRHFLRNVANILRQRNLRAGARMVVRLLPYVGRTISGIEKCKNVHNSYDVTDTISRHFLVDNKAKEDLDTFMDALKIKVDLLRQKIENLTHQLDMLLEDTFCDGKDAGIFVTLKLAFELNRISALIHTCEDHLQKARGMIDALDSHVAGKSFLANVTSLVCFIFGVVFSAGGNVPAAAVCMTAATASKKSAQNLEEYRKDLARIDKNHHNLQAELQEWKHHFRAERRNFFLIFGFKKLLVFFVLLGILLFFLGGVVNLILFAICLVYLILKSEETNDQRYYGALSLGVFAIVMQLKVQYGLIVYNTAAGTLMLAVCLGLVDIW